MISFNLLYLAHLLHTTQADSIICFQVANEKIKSNFCSVNCFCYDFNKFPEIKGILLTKCEITAYKNTQ